MARPVTGTIFFEGGRWKTRLSMPDGKRKVFKLPVWYTEEQAREKATEMAIAVRVQGVEGIDAVDIPKSETFEQYADRWHAIREEGGNTTVRSDRSRMKHHVLDILGPIEIRAIKATDLENVRDSLDAKIRNNELEWKTAGNVWALITSIFRDAVASKRRELRARDDNPSRDIEGPDRGAKKAKTYLYPSEFTALVSCVRIPIEWRRQLAIATYLYLRHGELEAVEWSDVDFEHHMVHITKAVQADGTLGSPKNGESRRVPVEPHLMSLLTAMREDAKEDETLIVSTQGANAARSLRLYLRWAGIKRKDLFTDDATRKQIGFHDATRATGITWMAVRGDDPLKIKKRAGHQQFSTTEGYIREAENVSVGFGEVFPPLPTALLSSATDSARSEAPRLTVTLEILPQSQYRRWGSNPNAIPDETCFQEPNAIADDGFDGVEEVSSGHSVRSSGTKTDANGAAVEAISTQLTEAVNAKNAADIRKLRAALDALLDPLVDASPEAPVVAIRRGK